MKICPVCRMHLADNIQSCFICGHSLHNCKTQAEEYNFHSMTSYEFEEKKFQYLMQREKYKLPVPPPQSSTHKNMPENAHNLKPVNGEMIILSLCALICSAIFFLVYLSTSNDFIMIAVMLSVIVAIVCYVKAQL